MGAIKRTSLAVTLALATLSLFAVTPGRAQPIPLAVGASPPEDAIALDPSGLDTALEGLPELVEDILARSEVPGIAVAVVHGGETLFAQGFGVRKLGRPEAVTADTAFQIASLSKPLSGTIGAIEVSAGVVDWNDTAISHLPDLRMANAYVTQNATIGDFFAHRTGLPLAAGDDLEDIGFARDEIIARLHMLPLDAFRTSYHYANFGITTGAEAIAAAAGQDWESLAQQALFDPLDMDSTSFRHDDFLKRDNRATLHAFVDGRFQPLYQRDPDAQAPAGGASSNVNDMAEWLKLLLAGGAQDGKILIDQAALVPAISPQAFSSPPHVLGARAGFYGYGFNVQTEANGRPSISHSGAFVLGAGTTMRLIPSADIGIVVLTNGAPVGAAEAIATQFLDIVQYGESSRDWFAGYNALLAGYFAPVGDLVGETPPADPAPARALDTYIGTYQNPFFGSAEIRQSGDGLAFIVGPANVTLDMTHWDADRFAVAPQNENAPDGSLSSLTFSGTGNAPDAFTVDYLDGHGMGTWKR